MEQIVIFITTASIDEAEKISNALVEQKLVACSNVISPIHSIFRWQGEICKEAEVLLILKSVKTRFVEIVTEVKKLHSYQTPEIIALPIMDGSPEYLQWVTDETK